MSEIADLIFDSNSTLFNVLDKLDVPSLSLEVKEISESLDSSKEQVRQLAAVVDNNQVANNTKFVEVNTRLDDLDDIVTGTTSDAVEALSKIETLTTFVRENIMRIDSNIASLERTLTTKIAALEDQILKTDALANAAFNDISLIGDDVIRVEVRVNNLDEESERLRLDVNRANNGVVATQNDVAGLTAQVETVQAEFSSVPISLEEIYFSTGHVLPGVAYRVVNQAPTNYTQRTLTLNNPVPYRSIRMGAIYSGFIDGVLHELIQFTDAITNTTGGSYQTQAGMVPIGGPINWRYRISAGQPLVSGVIRITKQFLR